MVEAGELVPLLACRNPVGLAKRLHLGGVHQPGVIVLVPLEGQTVPLDRIGDKAHRLVFGRAVKGFDQACDVMTAKIGHDARQFIVAIARDQLQGFMRAGQISQKLTPPGAGALEDKRRIERVGTGIYPCPQPLAARLGEQPFQGFAIFEGDDLPAHGLEQAGELVEQTIGHHRVEALPVIVDNPPAIADAVLPAFQQAFIDIAFIELRVANDGDHASFRPIAAKSLGADIILHQAGEGRHGGAQTHRPGREINVVRVLCPRGIGLRPAEGAKVFQIFKLLIAKQILDRVENGAGMGFDRDPVLRPERVAIECGHNTGA